ncbi:MAG: hypothetical protein ACRDIL_13240, partial [Candidatus Limnocylindrales bacterium]
MQIYVELDSTSGQDVYVDILDRTRFIKSATTAQPGDGATVEPYSVLVENIDARTLRLSWTDTRSTTRSRCTSTRTAPVCDSCSSS